MSDVKATIFVVDDNTRFRTSVVRLLTASGHTVEAFPCAIELLTRLNCEQALAGCVLADLDMPDVNGLELQARLASSPNPLPVVFLTGKGDIPSSVLAMRKGAEDFLTKLAPREVLLSAIGRALERDRVERAQRTRLHALKDLFKRLTPREHEVLLHVLKGEINKQIAAALNIDERSVKRHRTSFMAKLGVDSVASLVELCHSAGYPSLSGR